MVASGGSPPARSRPPSLRPLGSALLMPGSQGVLQAWKLLEKMRRLFRVVSLESSYRDTTKDACLLVSHGALALLLNQCAAAHGLVPY